jgi:uncharacterized protein YraI
MVSKRIVAAASILFLGSLACNLQLGQGVDQPDLAGTVTAGALTLEAPLATTEPSAEAASTGVQARVTSDTNCRTGPGQAYEKVFVAKPDQSFEVVGKNTQNNYWIVTDPAGGTCWLWGQYAVLSGDVSSLSEYPAPGASVAASTKTPKATKTAAPTSQPTTDPNAAPTAPAAPSGMAYSRTCEGYIGNDGFTPRWREEIDLTWQDNATNETGYWLYRNGSPLPVLPPDSTAYHITSNYDAGTGQALFFAFKVEAFNNYGASEVAGIDVPKCP